MHYSRVVFNCLLFLVHLFHTISLYVSLSLSYSLSLSFFFAPFLSLSIHFLSFRLYLVHLFHSISLSVSLSLSLFLSLSLSLSLSYSLSLSLFICPFSLTLDNFFFIFPSLCQLIYHYFSFSVCQY